MSYRPLRCAASSLTNAAEYLRDYLRSLGADSNTPEAAQAVLAMTLLEQTQQIVDGLQEGCTPPEEPLAQLPTPPPAAPTAGDGEPCLACHELIQLGEPRIQRPDDGETIYLHERCAR